MTLERLKKFIQREGKPFEPDPMQSAVLTVGDQWRMEGRPWWSVGTMNHAITELIGQSVEPFGLIRKINSLSSHGALNTKMGVMCDDDRLEPLSDVPQSENNSRNYFNYYSISEEGQRLRRGKKI